MADDRLLLTIAELTEILQPQVTRTELRHMLGLGRIKPVSYRSNGKPGHPYPEYDYADVAALHKALTPWLARNDPSATVSQVIEVP